MAIVKQQARVELPFTLPRGVWVEDTSIEFANGERRMRLIAVAEDLQTVKDRLGLLSDELAREVASIP